MFAKMSIVNRSMFFFSSRLPEYNSIIFRAVLIQIALQDCVIIIDISALKENVEEEFIKMFFEVFFDPYLKRVGFDLKSDLNFLRQAFPWIPEYLQNKQPEFYCVQSFANIVSLLFVNIFCEFW